MKVKNAKPVLFYGLHFQSGVAEYKDMEGQPVYYISPETCKRMDASYQGKPLFVQHQNDVNKEKVNEEADGIVVRSFFNQADGNHWAEFMVWNDEAIRVIKNGWVLSNAYDILSEKGSGTWHGVEYDTEIVEGEYEHLALVPNPRYADSQVLTPDQFKQYNQEKEEELKRLTNSKGDKPMFKIFKKTEADNSKDLALMSVVLPKTKVEKTITQLVNEADTREEMENGGSMIKVGNEEMSLEALKNFYMKHKKPKNEDEDEKPENKEDEKPENKEDEKPENKEDEKPENKEDEKPENEYAEKDEKMKNALDANKKLQNEIDALKKVNFDKLSNAHTKKDEEQTIVIETSADKVERGKKNYGSN